MHGFCGESISKTQKKTIVTVQNEVAYVYRERRKRKQNKKGRKKTTLKILVLVKLIEVSEKKKA
jgi:hypothetical protein